VKPLDRFFSRIRDAYLKENAMIDRLVEWAKQRRYQIAWGSGSVVETVRHEIASRRSGLELDAAFYDHELKSMIAAKSGYADRSLLLVAMPRPAHWVRFDIDGKIFDALLPPTYFRYRATFEDVRMDLAQNGLPGMRLEYLAAPLKATAGRLGLIRYGRNNISYVSGLGSYVQLCGYWTDATLPEMENEGKAAPSLLPECKDCGICRSVCPTEAISEDRVLIRAERCLTFLNENSGEWPEWMSPKAHNCLVGCLECQRACPANPELNIEHTGLAFSAAETRLLLSDTSAADARAETGIRAKLAWLGQPYIEDVLGRNLRALAKTQGVPPV
jgi:epoxyqueuosine reductase